MGKYYILVVVVVFLIWYVNSLEIRGMDPSLKEKFQGDEFTCLDGSKIIPKEYVNDDYCHCPDGSDEPGTSACSSVENERLFYCQNKGYFPKRIAMSKVDDGFCDCCDGSDEPEGKCERTCQKIGEKILGELEQELKKIRVGLALRKQYEIEASTAMAKERKKLEEAEQEKADLQPQLDDARKRMQLAEKQEDIERNIFREKLKEQKEEEKRKEEEKQKEEDQDDEGKGIAGEENEVQPSDDNTLDDSAESNDAAAVKQEENGEANTEEGSEASTDDSEDDKAIKEEEDPQEVKEFKTDEAELSRFEYKSFRSQMDEIETRISAAKKILDADFGPNNAYYRLQSKCFKIQDRSYDYELCPFDKSSQNNHGQNHGTSLGKWGEWADNYHTMKFTKGQSCWQGPQRTMTVSLECGESERITKVDETSKCVYAMTFKTPAACEHRHEIEVLNQIHEIKS